MRFAKSILAHSLENDWAIWRLMRRVNRGVLALGYHGVVRDQDLQDEWIQRLHIPLSTFETQMEFIALNFQVLDVSQVQSWQGKKPAVHLTFDDGFTNFATTALPVLQRLGLPASIYVISGLVGTDRRLPTYIGRAAIGNCPPGRMELDTVGKTFELSDTCSRQEAYSQISQVLKTGNSTAVTGLVSELKALLPTDQWSEVNDRFNSDSMMTWDDIDGVHRAGIVVGAHTADHFGLGQQQDPDVTVAQIRESVQAVQDRLGECRWFAYPNGTHEATSPVAAHELDRLSLQGAWTLIPGNVDRKSDRYMLPRIPVPKNMARMRLALNSPL